MTFVKPGVYKHYKGKEYRVFGTARHSETLQEFVMYDCLYENSNGKTWVRPVGMFLEEVVVNGKKQKRFVWLREV